MTIPNRLEANCVKIKTEFGNFHLHVGHLNGDIYSVSISSQGRIENSQIDNFVKQLFDAATLECEAIREKWGTP